MPNLLIFNHCISAFYAFKFVKNKRTMITFKPVLTFQPLYRIEPNIDCKNIYLLIIKKKMDYCYLNNIREESPPFG
jgi:hypothetical protein